MRKFIGWIRDANMTTESERTARSDRFRSAIAAFIEARREAKLKGSESVGDTASKYNYHAWLAGAARRVGWIQAVTHTLKATHPDARGSSLFVNPSALPVLAEIGSHLLIAGYEMDVDGNAAALDVFAFLKIEVDGGRLLDWMRAGDADLRASLHDDLGVAIAWMEAFNGLIRNDPTPKSHYLAKQVYWCVGEEPADNACYHLLQPLFSSILEDVVHADISDVRFGETNKLARNAFREKKSYHGSYREYSGLVERKLGGSKPLNVSQLNAERRGINRLLASLPPPAWSERLRNLLNLDSALNRFSRFEGVAALVKTLIAFLRSDPPQNEKTRKRRESMEQALGLQLLDFAASIKVRFEPGWTRDEDCRLPLCEQMWLDPERSELPPREDHTDEDEAFREAYDRGDWPDEIAGRFGNWLNDRLRDAGLVAVGDMQQRHWARQAVVDAAWPVPMQRRAGGP